MHINSRISGSFSPTVPSVASPDKSEARVSGAVPVVPAQAQPDSVQISAEGRARAAGQGSAPSLDPDRAAVIKQRIVDGAYNSLTMVDEVARRILDSGDL